MLKLGFFAKHPIITFFIADAAIAAIQNIAAIVSYRFEYRDYCATFTVNNNIKPPAKVARRNSIVTGAVSDIEESFKKQDEATEEAAEEADENEDVEVTEYV